MHIVKFRQSIAYGNIYISGHFLWLVREKSQGPKTQILHKLSFADLLSITLCSLDVNINVACILPWTRDRSDANLGNAPYRLQCVQSTLY